MDADYDDDDAYIIRPLLNKSKSGLGPPTFLLTVERANP